VSRYGCVGVGIQVGSHVTYAYKSIVGHQTPRAPCSGIVLKSGLCTVWCTVRYDFYCTYRNFVNYGVITIWEDVTDRNYGNLLYGVRYGIKLALPVQIWPQKGLSTPTPPISTTSMLRLRADATQCFPERP